MSGSIEPRAGTYDLERLKALAADALAEARRRGASSAEAGLSTSHGLAVTVRLGEVETIEHTRDKGLGLTVYFGTRKGSASTTDFRREAIVETVEAACRIARHTAEDPCAGLADPELMATDVPDLDLCHPWDLGPEDAIRLALEAEDAARGYDARITNSEGATISRHEGIHVYGNSHGFLEGYAGSRHSLTCGVIASDGDGMQRDHWYTISRVPGELEPAGAVGERAARRAVERLGASQMDTREVPVLFDPDTARGLVRHFLGAIRGASLYRDASFLVDHLGKQIFPSAVRLREQPLLPRALGSSPFDGEGVATRERDIVRDGVLEGYVLDSYSARKLGMQTTGNAGGVHNLVVEPGPLDFEGLLREMGSGLLVTELMGMGINIVTGDYSRGAAGYRVEGGEIREPVQEVTIAGNLRDMFLGIRAIGRDVDLRSNIRTGSILVDRMTVAGS